MQNDLQPYLQILRTYLRPQRRRTFLLGLVLFGVVALRLAAPQVLRSFIDSVQAGHEMDVLVRLALVFLAIALLQQAASVVATYFAENVSWAATNALRNDLADHLIHLDLSFHNARTPGEMIERIDGDITALSNFFSKFVTLLLANAVTMAGILVLLFLENWLAGAAITFFTTLTVYVLLRFRNIAVPHYAADRQASAELFGFLEERMAGAEDIRANGGRQYTMHHFYRLMRNTLQKALKAGLMSNIQVNTAWTLFSFGTAAAFAVGAYLFQAQTVTIGAVYIIYQYTSMLSRPIEELVRQVADLQKAGASITRVRELLDLQPQVAEPDSPTAPLVANRLLGSTAAPPSLEFTSVTFGYDDSLPGRAGKNGSGAGAAQGQDAGTGIQTVGGDVKSQQPQGGEPYKGSLLPGERQETDLQKENAVHKEMVLRDVSFRLEPGEVLGVLGRTGSGKTSLTRLVFRLYDPDQGSISLGLDGETHDLRRLPLGWLRSQVGMVTQNIQLFQASVRENLTFFDSSISDRLILDALHDLGLGSWLEGLPAGLDTPLASGDGGLSAGEGQLLAFVRIFLKDPGLVILDEASSRLDPATEHLIEQAVDRLLENRTALIVAHRLGTVQRAGQILIMEDGQVCEYGPRQALLADPFSRFSELMQTGLEEVLV